MFRFINRSGANLPEYIDAQELNEMFKEIVRTVFIGELTSDEKVWLDVENAPIFRNNHHVSFTKFMSHAWYAPYSISEDMNEIEFRGDWPIATWWEVPALATINELYFKGLMKAQGLNPSEVWENGEWILREKANMLKDYPELKFVDFGTRRRFSQEWHRHVIEMCLDLMPNNFIGTSNEMMAMELGIPAVGTMAHECPMGYSRLFGNSDVALRDSHHIFLQDWWEFYGETLSIALTDTFGSGFFFDTFTPEQADNWRGLRQDSGDPFAFGHAAIAFYKGHGIDPKEKTIVFSDGLTFEKMIALWTEFHDKFNVVFGIGTNLTNDMGCGLDPLSIVIKLAEINGLGTVKFSDNSAKAMGSDYNVKRFKEVFEHDDDYFEACKV